MAGMLKKHYPECKILFLGRNYTRDVILMSVHVDEFINFDELEKLSSDSQVMFFKNLNADVFLHVLPQKKIATIVKKSEIPLRVGTTNRIFHWTTCNKLIKLSRKNSPLHESQLNLKLLSFLGINEEPSLLKIRDYYGFQKPPSLNSDFVALIDNARLNIILHPKSKGSAKEWGTMNFLKLIDVLPEDKFKIFISGTSQDASLMSDFLEAVEEKKNVVDITGKMSLEQFIAFIYHCDGLVAASTGPLHISAALGKVAIGLFSSRRPIHPGRWQPIGKRAVALVYDPHCPDCAAGRDCNCITRIKPQQIIEHLTNETI